MLVKIGADPALAPHRVVLAHEREADAAVALGQTRLKRQLHPEVVILSHAMHGRCGQPVADRHQRKPRPVEPVQLVMLERRTDDEPLHVAGSLAVDRWQGSERVQLRVTDVAVPNTGPAVIR